MSLSENTYFPFLKSILSTDLTMSKFDRKKLMSWVHMIRENKIIIYDIT